MLNAAKRIEIYKLAYELYQKNWVMNGGTDTYELKAGDKACLGLCAPIFDAGLKLGYIGSHSYLNKQNFPEWFSYKPKTGWKVNPLFWWTISSNRGGTAKRMDILERLTKGLCKGE